MMLKLFLTRKPLLAALLALVALAAVPSLASANDSHAPAGAGARWLPCDDWVMLHWIPFDESDFARLTGAPPSKVLDWIRDDEHHTLGQLLVLKQISLDDAADKLTARWQGKVSDAKLQVLRGRTMEMLTQGHLSQHVLFHHFHDPVLAVHAQEVFGISRGDYTRARRDGFSPRQMGAHGGRTARQVKLAALRVMRRYMRKAIANQETTSEEAHRFYRRQIRYARRWLGQQLANPKGKKFPVGHASHKFDKQNELYCAIFVGKRHDGRQLEENDAKPVS